MIELKRALPEDQTQYVPPTKQEGLVKCPVLVSEGDVVGANRKCSSEGW